MRKGITPVVATVLLLVIAVAVVGLAYGFITGFIGATTSKAAIVSGVSSCSGGNAQITVTNGGTGSIATTDVVAVRTSGTAGQPTAWTPSGFPIGLQGSGTLTESGNPCGALGKCGYDVAVGGVIFPTRVNCP